MISQVTKAQATETCLYSLLHTCLFRQCGQLLYEKRQYEKGHWACIIMREDTYEQSICYGFMRIMKYICQQNSLGKFKACAW